MSNQVDDKPYTAWESYWIDPQEQTPPIGKKLLLLTQYGVAVLGHWYAEGQFIAWAPLPKIPESIKRKCRLPLSGSS